jgi:hypothetical protein
MIKIEDLIGPGYIFDARNGMSIRENNMIRKRKLGSPAIVQVKKRCIIINIIMSGYNKQYRDRWRGNERFSTKYETKQNSWVSAS